MPLCVHIFASALLCCVVDQVCLKHLEALWGILTDIASCDMFSKVHAKYKQELSERCVTAMSEIVLC